MSRYLISDLHLGDKHYLEKLNERQGISLTPRQHCELLINNCNNVLRKGKDSLYILGDVTIGYVNKEMMRFFRRVKCSKFLVAGNHDNDCVIKILRKYGFIQAMYGCFELEGYILTHIPVITTEINGIDRRYYKGNIHGHIHDKEKQDMLDSTLYYNVCANMNDFTPVDFEYIKEQLAKENEIRNR